MAEETVVAKDLKKFGDEEWNHIADYIYELYERRKKKRGDHEKVWKEVDRQIKLQPEVLNKRNADGKPDKDAWMPEMELPNQAIAHEILKSDARRMMFPDTGSWFKVFAGIDEKIIKAYQDFEFLAGEEMALVHQFTGSPKIDQEDINLVVQSFIEGINAQYDFTGHWDLINGEAFKYGTGVGRIRSVKKSVIARSGMGSVRSTVSIPALIPRTIKNVYLDDNKASVMAEGYLISQGDIEVKSQRIDDLRLAARQGSSDPKDEDGGWMKGNLAGVEGDENGLVEIIEYEGDLVVPQKTAGNMVLYNYLITLLAGKRSDKNDGHARRVIRCRIRDTSLPSYIIVPYDRENVESPYGCGPLMKGYPIQMGGSEAFNRTLMAMALDTEPVIRYDQDDALFAQQGGPLMHPGAQNATMGPIDILKIGNPAAMLSAYNTFNNQYADLTGMTGARLGQQTNSHTTAYAKGAEMERGTVRTVDYVRATLGGPMRQCLQVKYEMGRKNLKGKMPVFMNAVKMFINVSKELFPENVFFEVYGSAGPAEDAARMQTKLAAIQLAMNVDQIKVQMGLGQPLNYEEIQKQILREGGIEDVERFNISNSGGVAPASDVAGADDGTEQPGTISTALQGINFGQGNTGY